MKKRYHYLLLYLYERNDWLTAKQLAEHFNITDRTVRNYIANINHDFDGLILKERTRYKVNRLVYPKYVLEQRTENVPETPNERQLYQMEQLLTNEKGLNLTEALDYLFISDSTLMSDMRQISKKIQEHHLSLQKRGNYFQLVGDEKHRRALQSWIFYKKNDDSFIMIEELQQAFGDYDLISFRAKINQILAAHQLFVNDFTINSILLHILISSERILNHNQIELPRDTDLTALEQTKEFLVAKELKTEVETNFSAVLDQNELYYLTLLLVSKSTKLMATENDPHKISEFIDPYSLKLTQTAVAAVEELFLINFQQDEFIVKLALHVRNLMLRAKYHNFSKNPLTDTIKSSHTFIYELAIVLTNSLQEQTGYSIPECEITYLAFHIGSFIEQEKKLANKFKTLLVCDNYQGNHLALAEKLKQLFGDHLEIIQVLTTETASLNEKEFDLIISTYPQEVLQTEAITISHFLTLDDKESLTKKIKQLENRRNKRQMKTYMSEYLTSTCFNRNVYLESQAAYIHYLAQQLYEEGYVDKQFVHSVMERESLSPTAMNNIVAIPHALNMNAFKTAFALIANDTPIPWGKHTVQWIIMLSINREEANSFQKIYNSIIEVFSDNNLAKQMLHVASAKEFIDHLAELVSTFD